MNNAYFRYVRERLKKDIENNKKLRMLQVAWYWAFENITRDSADIYFYLFPMQTNAFEFGKITIKTQLQINRYFQNRNYVFEVYFVINTLGKYALKDLVALENMIFYIISTEINTFKKVSK